MSYDLIAAASEYESLLAEIRRLRGEITRLTAERDELKNQFVPRLQAQYNAQIGGLELQVFQAELRLRELKRAIEIMQAARNRCRQWDPQKAKEQARREYRSWQERARKAAERIHRSARYQQAEEEQNRVWEEEQKKEGTSGGRPFRSRADEMRHLYRKIVRRLHPDANPDITPEEEEMFVRAAKAYRNGDLQTLREIAARLDANSPQETYNNTPEGLEQLRKLVRQLSKSVMALEKEIQTIRAAFPYNQKDFLQDQEAVAARQKELTERLALAGWQYQELLKRFERLAGGQDPEGL